MHGAARIATALFAMGLAAPGGAGAQDVSSRGQVALEGRAFWPDDIERTEDFGMALAARLEAEVDLRPFGGQMRLFARNDVLDDTRDLVAIEELYLSWRERPLRLRVGWQLLNWSATEAFHPADVINARNYDSRLENPDKLGEPMAELQVRVGEGTLSAYYMPLRRGPILPSASSRLSPFPVRVPIAVGDPIFAGRDRVIGEDRLEHQWAVRIAQTLGDADVSLHVLQHVDRSQPTQVIENATGEVRPLFHFVTQVGGTWQQVFGPVIGKLEVAHREFGFPDPDPAFTLLHREQLDHTQIAAGLEVGWGAGEGEGTLIVEGQVMIAYDEPQFEEPDLGPFQRDVLVGYRHSFNDIAGTRVQGGVIVDLEDASEMLVLVRFERRLSDVWALEANARAVLAEPEGATPAAAELAARGLERWDGASEVNLTLARYF